MPPRSTGLRCPPGTNGRKPVFMKILAFVDDDGIELDWLRCICEIVETHFRKGLAEEHLLLAGILGYGYIESCFGEHIYQEIVEICAGDFSRQLPPQAGGEVLV